MTEDSRPLWKRAPKPLNFDALAAAWDDDDTFQIEAAKYRTQCNRAGINPGTTGDTP